MRKIVIIIGGAILGVVVILLSIAFLFIKPVDPEGKEVLFVISRANQSETTKRLQEGEFIRSPLSLSIARLATSRFGEIKPGGYKISKSMDTRKLITILTSEPQLKWITIPEGLRKEEIGERIGEEIHWSDEDLEKWNTIYTAMEFDYREGVYFRILI